MSQTHCNMWTSLEKKWILPQFDSNLTIWEYIMVLVGPTSMEECKDIGGLVNLLALSSVHLLEAVHRKPKEISKEIQGAFVAFCRSCESLTALLEKYSSPRCSVVYHFLDEQEKREVLESIRINETMNPNSEEEKNGIFCCYIRNVYGTQIATILMQVVRSLPDLLCWTRECEDIKTIEINAKEKGEKTKEIDPQNQNCLTQQLFLDIMSATLKTAGALFRKSPHGEIALQQELALRILGIEFDINQCIASLIEGNDYEEGLARGFFLIRNEMADYWARFLNCLADIRVWSLNSTLLHLHECVAKVEQVMIDAERDVVERDAVLPNGLLLFRVFDLSPCIKRDIIQYGGRLVFLLRYLYNLLFNKTLFESAAEGLDSELITRGMNRFQQIIAEHILGNNHFPIFIKAVSLIRQICNCDVPHQRYKVKSALVHSLTRLIISGVIERDTDLSMPILLGYMYSLLKSLILNELGSLPEQLLHSARIIETKLGSFIHTFNVRGNKQCTLHQTILILFWLSILDNQDRDAYGLPNWGRSTEILDPENTIKCQYWDIISHLVVWFVYMCNIVAQDRILFPSPSTADQFNKLDNTKRLILERPTFLHSLAINTLTECPYIESRIYYLTREIHFPLTIDSLDFPTNEAWSKTQMLILDSFLAASSVPSKKKGTTLGPETTTPIISFYYQLVLEYYSRLDLQAQNGNLQRGETNDSEKSMFPIRMAHTCEGILRNSVVDHDILVFLFKRLIELDKSQMIRNIEKKSVCETIRLILEALFHFHYNAFTKSEPIEEYSSISGDNHITRNGSIIWVPESVDLSLQVLSILIKTQEIDAVVKFIYFLQLQIQNHQHLIPLLLEHSFLDLLMDIFDLTKQQERKIIRKFWIELAKVEPIICIEAFTNKMESYLQVELSASLIDKLTDLILGFNALCEISSDLRYKFVNSVDFSALLRVLQIEHKGGSIVDTVLKLLSHVNNIKVQEGSGLVLDNESLNCLLSSYTLHVRKVGIKNNRCTGLIVQSVIHLGNHSLHYFVHTFLQVVDSLEECISRISNQSKECRIVISDCFAVMSIILELQNRLNAQQTETKNEVEEKCGLNDILVDMNCPLFDRCLALVSNWQILSVHQQKILLRTFSFLIVQNSSFKERFRQVMQDNIEKIINSQGNENSLKRICRELQGLVKI